MNVSSSVNNHRQSSRKSLVFALFWAIFLNGILASVISLRVFSDINLPESSLALIYLVLQQLGHFQFLAFLAGLPLLLIILVLPVDKVIRLLSIIVFSTFTALVFIDYSVFSLYRFHLNGMVWNMLTGGAMEEIFVFDMENIVTFSFFILLILLIQAGIQFLIGYRLKTGASNCGWIILGLVLFIQILGQSLYAWSDVWYKTEVLSQQRFVPLAQAITIKRFLRDKGWFPDMPEHPQIKISSNGEFNYPLQALQCETPVKKPNILFILSDGLRFDMLDKAIMPVWSELAAQGQVFERHLSSGNATRFGVYGLFSGLYSHYWFDSLNSQAGSVLIDQLKQQDYEFGFFSNARLTSPEFDKTIFAAVREHIPQKTSGANVIEREYEITRQATSFMRNNKDRPFFGLVFFDAPHAYVYPEQDEKFKPVLESINYLKINNDTDPLPFLNRYKNAVHFTDRLTGTLVETLKQQGMLENTIIILTGDHGQEANETKTNSWGHNSNFSRYQIQVPLIIYWPGKQARLYSHLTSHVDIVPTLMQEVFACRNRVEDYSNGRSLFRQEPRDFVLVKSWSNQAVVNEQLINVYPKIGPAESRDFLSYRELPHGQSSGISMGPVIQEISRFYRD